MRHKPPAGSGLPFQEVPLLSPDHRPSCNEFDEENGINVYDLTLFLPREDGLYERDEEIH